MEDSPGSMGEAPSPRKLAILGLPWETTVSTLQSHFSQYGTVVDAVVMRDRASGRSRGFGFVTFAAVEEAQAVIAMGHEIDGRRVEAKFAVPKDPASSGSGGSGGGGGGVPTTRIFIARVAPEVSEEDFRLYFEQFGSILDAYMPKDHHTRRHRGIGFVTYDSPEPVEVIMNSTHTLAGQEIAIDRATPKDARSGGGGYAGGGMGGGRGGMAGGRGNLRGGAGGGGVFGAGGDDAWGMGMPPPPVQAIMMGMQGGMDYGGLGGYGMGIGAPAIDFSEGARRRVEAGAGGSRGGGAKIFVGRLDPSVTENNLRAYFGKFGQLVDVYMPKDVSRNTHRGFGFVTFDSDITADRVASMPHEINGRAVAIDRATPKDTASIGPMPGHAMGLAAMGPEARQRVAAGTHMMAPGYAPQFGSLGGGFGLMGGFGLAPGAGGDFLAGGAGGFGDAMGGMTGPGGFPGGGPYRGGGGGGAAAGEGGEGHPLGSINPTKRPKVY